MILSSRQQTAEDEIMTTTDLYTSLISLRQTLFQRIAGTNGKWKAHWQQELMAVEKCIWVLGNTP